MPVQVVRNKQGKIIGYRWGNSGKIYKTRAEAERQGRAIKAAQAQRNALVAKIKQVLFGDME